MGAAECRTNKWREADDWWLEGGWRMVEVTVEGRLPMG